ncbi:glycosyltransferase family 2 protein [Nocardioides daphniae]|uniref:Glycosyltransferase n=1 Tax=Nocardioides daphniae TaxID=402297 RepID=A0A4P7U9X3_9ACTN|nr:glycosyltransferase [Nocardioides daphniae]QCC76903.1 glycosyltransferase [Nocardioides daphniae]
MTAERESAGAVADVMRVVRADGTGYLSRAGIGEGVPTQRAGIAAERLLLRRATLDEVGLDPTLPSAWEFALLARVAPLTGVPLVASVGVVRHLAASSAARGLPGPRRPVSNPREVAAWADVVLNDLLVDWEAEREVIREADVVSVVIPTYADWEMTSTAVDRVVEHAAETHHRLQVVVVDNGNDPDAAVMLDLLTLKHDCVEVDHRVANLGYALGNNVAVPRLRGETVVFLNNDTEVQSRWLAPLVDALADDTVLGSQPLLLYPDGSIQCAGLAFPSTGGLAHGFLTGFPVEDAAGIEELPFHAVTGACLVMRTRDVVALRGFDPVFTNGMEDVDLCLRAAEVRPGRFTVRPDSVVVHHESRTPGRHRHYAVNRRVFLERWRGRMPQDDAELWRPAGSRSTATRSPSTSSRTATWGRRAGAGA